MQHNEAERHTGHERRTDAVKPQPESSIAGHRQLPHGRVNVLQIVELFANLFLHTARTDG